ncbi:MAG: hypothetical protein RIS76_2819 [Verrucomicrobiota bacterium]
MTLGKLWRLSVAVAMAAAILPLQAGVDSFREGVAVPIGQRTATLVSRDTLPLVDNEYSRRFRFDQFENPKLQELRLRHGLDAVVSPGRDEFERQLLLMDWTHRQFTRFGRPSTNVQGALEILQAIQNGHTFFCSQYAQLMVSAAASLGWVDRPLALRRHQGVAAVGGSTEHSVTEIWSNQHSKWVMLDPTSNLYLETNGVPLNAVEIRQEWFYHSGTNLVFRVGRDRQRYRKADLPIRLRHFDDFGELAIHPDELDKYGFTAFIPNTDLMDSGFDYGGMFLVKDSLCDGTTWHVRTVPQNPASDPYFPVGQAAMELTPEKEGIRVSLRTMTPNFLRFEMRKDNGAWTATDASFPWEVRVGRNRMEARTVNRFGVSGPVAASVIEVSP